MKYLLTLAVMSGILVSIMLASTPRSEFAPYIQSFQAELDARQLPIDASRVPIQFGPTRGADIGYCIIAGQTRLIIISRPYWNRATKVEREMLIFHELGHCILNRDHDDHIGSSGVPHSIMASGLAWELVWTYTRNRDAYIDELFRHVGVRRTN